MINDTLRRLAKEIHTPLWILEKDYAISYILLGVSRVPALADVLVLKGGTALRKAYFQDYRFSEDLDYSTRSGAIPDIDALMQAAVRQAETELQRQGPFQVFLERLHLREPHPGDQAAYTLRVQFPTHRRLMCRLKVEITIDEPIVLHPEECPVLHAYSDDCQATTFVYPLAEIAAEKLRALLQSQARLQNRGWGASRACRDYYDLWQIFRRADFRDVNLPELVARKCQVREVAFRTPNDFFTPELLETIRREWAQMLVPFVPISPPAPEQIIEETQDAVLQLWQR